MSLIDERRERKDIEHEAAAGMRAVMEVIDQNLSEIGRYDASLRKQLEAVYTELSCEHADLILWWDYENEVPK